MSVNIASKNVLAKLMATENIHVEHRKVQTASFDVKNRVLSLPMWEDMDDSIYEGLIGHEVGHALYTPFEEWVEFVKTNPGLKDYANIIEDARIERKMKVKYPGMKKTFFSMYGQLKNRDFFGTKGRELDSYGLLDRINIHFKLGVMAEVPFTDDEKVFVGRIMRAESFEDVLALTLELAEKAKEEQAEINFDNFDFDDESGDESESEEESTPPPPSSSGDTEEESDESESEEESGESGESGDESGDESESEESPPESETMRNFEDSLSRLNNENAKDIIYVDLPNVAPENVIVGYKDVLGELSNWWDRDSAWGYGGYDRWGQGSFRKQLNENFRSWKKDTLPVVNYLVKEFEMKQAATAHRRTSVGKTGVIDTNKLHAYKIDEDIFKRVATVRDGRNHGLVMYIDWSVSMSDKIVDTIKQALTLVMFARKVGIPFRVYSFTNSKSTFNKTTSKSMFKKSNQTSSKVLDLGKVAFHEFFNDRMSGREFNKQIENMFYLGKSLVSYGEPICPDGFSLGSTPLNEAIIASYDMVADFKRTTGKEKINVIFLTDGGTDGNTGYLDCTEDDLARKYISYGEKMMLRDPVTKKIICKERYNMTHGLLSGLGSRCGVNVIGFHITSTKHIRNNIEYTYSWEEVANKKKFLTKNGYVGIQEAGYDTYFLINSKCLDKEAEFVEPGRKDDGSINKGKLRTQFRKFTKARKVNKMMLNEFVALVA